MKRAESSFHSLQRLYRTTSSPAVQVHYVPRPTQIKGPRCSPSPTIPAVLVRRRWSLHVLPILRRLLLPVIRRLGTELWLLSWRWWLLVLILILILILPVPERRWRRGEWLGLTVRWRHGLILWLLWRRRK